MLLTELRLNMQHNFDSANILHVLNRLYSIILKGCVS